MQKAPSDPWPHASRGLTIELLPGVHQAGELEGLPDMTIQGGEGVVIAGSLRPSGGEPPCSLRILDGAHRLRIIGPLEIRNSDGRGLRVTAAGSIAISDVYSHGNRIEGIITGNCPGAVYENIRVEDSRSPAAGYTPDKCHGLYISGDASGSTVTGLCAIRVTGSGFQANGAGMNAVIRSLSASQMEFIHCGSGGTPPISLMAVQDSTISEFCEDWTAGDRWAVCFADGKGAKYACRNVTFRNYTVPDGTECAALEGSSDITCQPGDGWSPDEGAPEPEPEPEPEPAYDPQPDLDILRAELAVARLALMTAEDARARLEAGLAGE
jgi:hypothetical protein